MQNVLIARMARAEMLDAVRATDQDWLEKKRKKKVGHGRTACSAIASG